MITIGIQTKGILPDYSPQEGAAKIAKAGFERVDFNLDCFLTNKDVYAGRINPFFDHNVEELKEYFLLYKKAFDENGIKPSQMHAPYPVWVQKRADVSKYMQTTVIPKSIAIAGVMEIPWVVIHPFKMQYAMGIDVERYCNLEYFKSIIPLLKEHHVKVCVENLYEGVGGRITEGVCADPRDAIWYVDTLNEIAGEELFGICLDLGHLQLVRRDPYDYIFQVGNRLKIMHIHENDGIGDLHHMPYTFGADEKESTDWQRYVQALREIGYDGTLSFETFPCMNSFPLEARDESLRMIYEIGNYWRESLGEK